MAAKKGASGGKGQGELLTLSEVSRRTKISMPTLQRYKKEYQDRIPSEGEGRRQRYPVESLSVFEEIKKENLKKRGRPPKSGSAKKTTRRSAKQRATRKGSTAAKKAAASPKEKSEVFSLLQISKITGIEYTKLQRLTKKYADMIPIQGSGRTRRYYAEAIDIYEKLEAEGASKARKVTASVKGKAKKVTGRVRRAARKKAADIGLDEGGLRKKVAALEEVNAQLRADVASLQKDVNSLVRNLKKGFKVTVLK